MISRRNIRVKVMQTLYAVESQEGSINSEEAVKLLQQQFQLTRALLVFLVQSMVEISRYAERDARYRAAKHLPTEKDLRVNTKIAGNEAVQKIIEHPSYRQAEKEDKPGQYSNPDMVRKLYQELAEQDAYHSYIADAGRERKSERDILEFLFTQVMLPSEAFTSFVEENFNNWDDDAEMMHQLVINFLQKPGGFNFQEIINPEKWDFAKGLLETVIEKKELALDYIKPKLKNWDPDRIAVMDMLLMRMGVCEFLFFETIPPKVTINEYIDLAKDYSTSQSGQFVNGILDNIHKDLLKENKMNKVSFRPPK